MKKNTLKKELDWVSMLVPLAIVLTVCALFMIFPEGSKLVLSVVRGFLFWGMTLASTMHCSALAS